MPQSKCLGPDVRVEAACLDLEPATCCRPDGAVIERRKTLPLNPTTLALHCINLLVYMTVETSSYHGLG
jgi:hypothetical protein